MWALEYIHIHCQFMQGHGTGYRYKGLALLDTPKTKEKAATEVEVNEEDVSTHVGKTHEVSTQHCYHTWHC